MLSRLKFAGKIGIAVFFALMVTIAGIVACLKTVPVQRMILNRVNTAIPGTVDFEDFRFSLLDGAFELIRLSLVDPSGKTVVRLDRLLGDIEWTALLDRTLAVTDLLLESPIVNLHRDNAGNTNLIQTFTAHKSPSSSPKTSAPRHGVFLNTVVKSVRLSNGTLRFRDDGNRIRIAMHGMDAEANVDVLKQTGQLTFNSRGGEIQHSRFKTTLSKLKIASAYRNGRADPVTIECHTPLGTATLTGAMDQLTSAPNMDLLLEMMIDAASLKSDFGIDTPLTGRIAARATLRGSVNNPKLTWQSDYSNGNIAGVRIDAARIIFSLEDRILRLNDLDIRSPSGALRASADIDMQSMFPYGFLSSIRDSGTVTYQINIRSPGVDLATLGHRHTDLSGIVNGTLMLEGKGIHPHHLSVRNRLNVTAKNLSTRLNATPVDVHIETEATADRGIVRLLSLLARVGDTRLNARGQVGLVSKAVTARLELDSPSLERDLSPLGITDVRGKVNATAELSGHLSPSRSTTDPDPLEASLLLNGNALEIKDIRLGDLSTKIRMNGENLYVDHFGLHNQHSAVNASGQVRLFASGTFRPLPDPTFSVDIRGDTIFLEDFVDDLKGRLSLVGGLEGSKNRPRGRVKIQGERLDLGVQKMEGLHVETVLDGETARITRLEATIASNESIAGSGWISMQKSFAFNIATSGVDLLHIDRLREQGVARGVLVFDLSGEGRLDNPAIKGDVAVEHFQINNRAMNDVDLRFHLEDRLARVSGRLNFDVDARYHLPDKNFSISLDFHQADLSPYFRLVDRKELSGLLTGNFQATGNAASVRRVRASIDVSRLDIFSGDTKLIDAKPFRMALENEEIFIPGLHLGLIDEGQIDVKGRAKHRGPVSMAATGNIPLRILNLFTDSIPDPTGNVLFSSRMQGDLNDVPLTADVTLKNAGFTLPVTLQKLQRVNGRIRITPRALTLEDVQGQLDSGQLRLFGRIDLKSFHPSAWNLEMTAENCPVSIPDTLSMLLNADVKYTGSASRSVLVGEAVLLEGEYYRNVNLNLAQNMVEKQRKPSPKSSGQLPAFLKNTDFNIVLRSRTPFRVDNNLALLEIKPDLRLGGKPDNPAITGRAAVESGTIAFRKNSFTVNKGVIDFINPYGIEPIIDIESDTQVRQWIVRLGLSGPPDALSFRLTSEPAETEEDILSLLLFRKTTRELIEADGGITKSTEQLMAEIIGETFGEDIKKATGLDTIKIETVGGGDAADPDRTRLTLGKDISRRLTLKYALEAKNGEMVQRAITEYKLLENILLNGFQDTQGIFGGGVKLRLEFR